MDFDESERPRERLAALGAQALSTAELLAILLRVGVKGQNAIQVGQGLLKEFQGLGGLHQASFEDLQRQSGVGPAKAAQLKAAMELGRRLALELPEDRPTIHSPADAAALVQYELSALTQEELWVLLLDTRNRLLRIEKLYRGSLNASTVRVAEVFKCAIRWNSASIVVVHNHPSGDPAPSPEDTALTRTLVSAGKLMDLEVLDHLVIGRGKFISMKERGLGFS